MSNNALQTIINARLPGKEGLWQIHLHDGKISAIDIPGIVPVNAVLGGALSYLILNPILNRKTTAAMTHVEVNSVE